MKGPAKYYFFPFLYTIGLILVELYPNIISIGIWVISALVCTILIFWVVFEKIDHLRKVFLLVLLSLPILNLIFDFSLKIRNQIKGEIVLNILDDSFATTKSITVRQKNGELKAEYDYSVAGFGEIENARAKIENDSVLVVILNKRNYSEKLIFNKINNSFENIDKKLKYRILENKLFK